MKKVSFTAAAFVGLAMAVATTASAQVYQPVFNTSVQRLPAVTNVYQPVVLHRGQADGTLVGMDSMGMYGEAANCGCDEDVCCEDVGCWRDNMSFFVAGDAFGSKLDDNNRNNFGYKVGFNSGWGLREGSKIRGQFGASYGAYQLYGRDTTAGVDNTRSVEQQVFVTAGLYKRSDVANCDNISWGIVYDWMNDSRYGEEGTSVSLSQVRARMGYAWDEANEFGLKGSLHVEKDDLTSNVQGDFETHAMDQVSMFWKHNWAYGADTELSVGGAATEPGDVILGLRGHAPLSCRVALYGDATFIMPSTTAGDVAPNNVENRFGEEAWNVTFGLVYYPGGKASARNVSGSAGLPLLNVADNGNFVGVGPAGNL